MTKNNFDYKYVVYESTWNQEEECFEDESEFWTTDGVEAMKKIADYLKRHPNAKDGSIASDPDDRMFVCMREINEKGDEYWLDACCIEIENK